MNGVTARFSKQSQHLKSNYRNSKEKLKAVFNSVFYCPDENMKKQRTHRYEFLAPLSPVLRGEGSGVRGCLQSKIARDAAPSSPALLPRSTGGEGCQIRCRMADPRVFKLRTFNIFIGPVEYCPMALTRYTRREVAHVNAVAGNRGVLNACVF